MEIEYILRPCRCFDLGYSPPDDLCAPSVCDAWCSTGVQDEESAVETREAEEEGRRETTDKSGSSIAIPVHSPRAASDARTRAHTGLLACLSGRTVVAGAKTHPNLSKARFAHLG